MSNNPHLSPSVGPLSVGNVVSAGLRIYRDRFQLYYPLAFKAYLWILIPIYGWAKFAAISGLISRLTFAEVVERPETLPEARRQVNSRLWTFFVAGLLVGLIFVATILGFSLIGGIVFAILAALAQQNTAFTAIIILSAIIAILAFVFGYIWLYSRLSLVELPIAIENQSDATAAISRSWILTEGFVLRLQLIFFVAFLITLPISLLMNLISSIVQVILTVIFPPDSVLFNSLYFIISLAIAFAGGALLIPFWQAIKAIIYYDLRSRKEAIDLEIRDS
jgi:hypothetical protein